MGLVLLLAIAIFGWVMVSSDRSDETATEVVESQQRHTDQLGGKLRASTETAVAQLSDSAKPRSGDSPGRVAQRVVDSDSGWTGAAVFDRADGKMEATKGAPVKLPRSLLKTNSPVALPIGADGTQINFLVAAPASDSATAPIIAGTKSMSLSVGTPADKVARGLMLVSNGKVLTKAGAGGSVAAELAGEIQRDGATSGHLTNPAGTVGEPNRTQLATYTEIGGPAAGNLDLALVSYADTGVAVQDEKATLVVAALIVLAVLGFVVLRVFLVRPVQRLRADAMAVAAGGLGTQVHSPQLTEAGKISDTLDRIRLRLGGPIRRGTTRRRTRVPALGVVAVATALMLGWSGYVAVTFGAEADVPQRILDDANDEAAREADGVAKALGSGVGSLRDIARKADSPSDSKAQLEQLVETDGDIHSAAVVDAKGDAQVSVGGRPLADLQRAPGGTGVWQANTSGRLPIVLGYTPLGDGKHTLIAEFDTKALSGISSQFPVRLLDREHRVLADTGGFIAFEQANAEEAEMAAAVRKQNRPTAAVRDVDSEGQVLAAAPVAGNKYADSLGWSIVSDKPVRDLNLPANEQRRAALTIALLAALVALGTGGWHYFVHIHQLRQLRRDSEEVLADPENTVVFPQRHDEIGAVATCLETCRQAMVDGSHWLGTLRETSAAPVKTPAAAPVKAEVTTESPAPVAVRAGHGEDDDSEAELIGVSGKS